MSVPGGGDTSVISAQPAMSESVRTSCQQARGPPPMPAGIRLVDGSNIKATTSGTARGHVCAAQSSSTVFGSAWVAGASAVAVAATIDATSADVEIFML